MNQWHNIFHCPFYGKNVNHKTWYLLNPYFFRDIADVTAHTMKYEYLSFKQKNVSKLALSLIYIYLLSAYLKFRIELQQDEKYVLLIVTALPQNSLIAVLFTKGMHLQQWPCAFVHFSVWMMNLWFNVHTYTSTRVWRYISLFWSNICNLISNCNYLGC